MGPLSFTHTRHALLLAGDEDGSSMVPPAGGDFLSQIFLNESQHLLKYFEFRLSTQWFQVAQSQSSAKIPRLVPSMSAKRELLKNHVETGTVLQSFHMFSLGALGALCFLLNCRRGKAQLAEI